MKDKYIILCGHGNSYVYADGEEEAMEKYMEFYRQSSNAQIHKVINVKLKLEDQHKKENK